jgi:hypothetical protein
MASSFLASCDQITLLNSIIARCEPIYDGLALLVILASVQSSQEVFRGEGEVTEWTLLSCILQWEDAITCKAGRGTHSGEIRSR